MPHHAKYSAAVLAIAFSAAAFAQSPSPAQPPRNILLFVADGLRHASVNPTDAPTMSALRQSGVDFVNSHSLLPTVTTPNASAIATGHWIADTGNFSNNLFPGFPALEAAKWAATHSVENDPIIADLNAHFSGNYLGEQTLLAAAHAAGYNTAAIGKLGPALVQDATLTDSGSPAATGPNPTILMDDATGLPAPFGIPLPKNFRDRLANDPYFLKTYFDNTPPEHDPRSPIRGENGTSGTKVANVDQQKYFADVATRAVLPYFLTQSAAATPKPFMLVYWSRDPDGTQHNQGDSLDQISPGINGPTSKAAIHNADDNLKQLVDFLSQTPDPAAPGEMLSQTTDVFITSDHGFATISKQPLDAAGTPVSTFAAQQVYKDVLPGMLPPGFLAIDLAHDLSLPLFDAANGAPIEIKDAAGHTALLPEQTWIQYRPIKLGGTKDNPADALSDGNALIGGGSFTSDGFSAPIAISACGGSDLIYLNPQRLHPDSPPPESPSILAKKIVADLIGKPYVSGIFVDADRFGQIPGTLPLADIGLRGSARTPAPAIAVNFKSFSLDPANPELSGVDISDTGLEEGQGTHGSFGRHNTFNCMIAAGPDFKTHLSDTDPVSNADIAITLSRLMQIDLLKNARGENHGRLIDEALSAGPALRGSLRLIEKSVPASNGKITTLLYQTYIDASGRTCRYFDAAGFPGETVGVPAR